jgi:hypothetical protein
VHVVFFAQAADYGSDNCVPHVLHAVSGPSQTSLINTGH